jgi:PAS domain-containing protein
VTTLEQERLAALHEYRLLDAPADDELEAVVRVAAVVAGVPYATLNLIDENRQCQLTTAGFEGGDSTRSDSMCAITFEAGEFVWTPDAGVNPVYQANPWVTGLLGKVRLYASAPLVTPQGYALGTLCVFDEKPGTLTAEQIARLKDLAGVILALFERRRQARINGELLREAEARQEFTDVVLETIDVAVVAADPSGHLTLFNRAARDWHGLDADPTIDPRDFSDRYKLFRTDGLPMTEDEVPLLRALHGGRVVGAEMIIKHPGRNPVHVNSSGRALTAPDGSPLGAVVAMNDVTPDRAQRAALAATNAELQRSNTELERAIRDSGASVFVDPGLPVASCDPTLIRQLMQNLIGNAIKYRHPDRACRLSVSARPEGGEWLVSVTDNGVGIPPEHRARVFEMFTRVDHRAPGGHGVGLSTCQRIVERHGGRIWAGAADGGGTVVTFSLPGA